MFIIPCPWCGDCAMTEFSYGGDASRPYPGSEAGFETWYDYVYLRDNPKGPHDEFWHHAGGCRQWLKVRRDTLSHEILAACAADRPLDQSTAKPSSP